MVQCSCSYKQLIIIEMIQHPIVHKYVMEHKYLWLSTCAPSKAHKTMYHQLNADVQQTHSCLSRCVIYKGVIAAYSNHKSYAAESYIDTVQTLSITDTVDVL